MRKPQRNFVVEFKTSRNATRTPVRSIWGDTDLKAISVQVEDFIPTPRGASVVRDAFTASAKGTATLPVCADVSRQPKILEDLSYTDTACALEVRERERASVLRAVPARLGGAISRKVGKASKMTEKQTPAEAPALDAAAMIPVAVKDTTGSAVAVDVQLGGNVSMDQLAALQAEYMRLLGLAAERLAAENAIIRAELERVERDFEMFASL